MFCAAVIRAVHKYGGLLRASVASATNDHRLGANEAPPAIISIFLGEQLTDVFEQIAKGGATSVEGEGHADDRRRHAARCCPTDPGDRNRTSPFAFTGNRFEFRAPGSLQSIAGPMVAINTILAESLDYIATELESLVAGGTDFNAAVQKVLEEIITDARRVVFNGDGYSEEWQVEAESRGLPNLRTTLDALPRARSPTRSMELFSHYGVFSHRELHSRYEIALEQYVLSIGVEARTTLEMANTVILPAALRYQTELATNVVGLTALGHRGRHVDARRGVGVDRRRCGPASPGCAPRSPTSGGTARGGGDARRDRAAAGHGRGAHCGRHARGPGGRRPLAARDLPGDAVHPLGGDAGPGHRWCGGDPVSVLGAAEGPEGGLPPALGHALVGGRLPEGGLVGIVGDEHGE